MSPKLESICVFCEMIKEDGKEDDNAEEYLIVYSMAKEDPKTGLKEPVVKLKKLILDLDEYGTYKETPSKLYTLIRDGTQVVLRDEKRTGVKIFSLDDGSMVAHLPELHKKAIYNIQVMQDNKTIVTGGKDKVLKVTDAAS